MTVMRFLLSFCIYRTYHLKCPEVQIWRKKKEKETKKQMQTRLVDLVRMNFGPFSFPTHHIKMWGNFCMIYFIRISRPCEINWQHMHTRNQLNLNKTTILEILNKKKSSKFKRNFNFWVFTTETVIC